MYFCGVLYTYSIAPLLMTISLFPYALGVVPCSSLKMKKETPTTRDGLGVILLANFACTEAKTRTVIIAALFSIFVVHCSLLYVW